jgi:hypothetical protein
MATSPLVNTRNSASATMEGAMVSVGFGPGSVSLPPSPGSNGVSSEQLASTKIDATASKRLNADKGRVISACDAGFKTAIHMPVGTFPRQADVPRTQPFPFQGRQDRLNWQKVAGGDSVSKIMSR